VLAGYQIGIRLLNLLIRLAAPFSTRAAALVAGRKLNRNILVGYRPDPHRRTLWMHVSSLGEFEQGRPLIEAWKKRFPDDRILLSFFSPSGYEIRKDYPIADLVFYLPEDTRKQMERLTDRLRPDLFILVKYDFWPNLLDVLRRKGIDSCLISARFQREQYLFRRWGRSLGRQLRLFRWIFVQDEESAALLQKHLGLPSVVAGDTRVDSVMERVAASGGVPEPLRRDYRVIVGGSTWPPEEEMLERYWKSKGFETLKPEWRLIIAPHDIREGHLAAIEARFPGETVRLSHLEGELKEALQPGRVVLVDTIGRLFDLYRIADLAVIGGGFGKGIHNILEPAAHGLPVVFGPKWTRFGEAHSLVDSGAAFPVGDYPSFEGRMTRICSDGEYRRKAGLLALNYIEKQAGSTSLIIRHLLEKP
jgi:3-deoxy-D-manno-octulosonic-acid transferase